MVLETYEELGIVGNVVAEDNIVAFVVVDSKLSILFYLEVLMENIVEISKMCNEIKIHTNDIRLLILICFYRTKQNIKGKFVQ